MPVRLAACRAHHVRRVAVLCYQHRGVRAPDAVGWLVIHLQQPRAGPDGIQATAREGDVFLTGTVSYSAQQAAAEDAAAGVAGVLSVTNQIEVQRGA
jgi:BON domain